MRSDMSKVIVERPRRGSRGGAKGRRRAERELDGPRQEGMRRAHSNHKSLNENLTPLKRFLGSRVGKHWPKVYSEISEHLRPSNAVQQHVRDHLEDFVATRTALRNGKVFVHVAGFRGGAVPLEQAWARFYVHPTSGVLMRNKHGADWKRALARQRQAARTEVEQRRRALGDSLQLHKLMGCWFAVALAPLPPKGRPYTDVVIDGGFSDLPRLELYGRNDRHAVAKRQLGRKELARYDLKNDG